MPAFDEDFETPSGSDALENEESLSPVVDDTDADDTSGDADVEDRSSKTKGKGGETEELRKKLENYERRIQGQTISWQQEKAKREETERRYQENLARLQRWQQHGVNPDEIDRLIAQQEAQAGGGQQQQQQGLPDNLLTKEEFAQALAWQNTLSQWEGQKDTFLEKESNADFDTPSWRKWMDQTAIDVTNEEMAEYGYIVSKPKDVIKKVEKRLREMVGKLEKKAHKSANETRVKVNEQGTVESSQRQRRKSGDDESQPWTREGYVNTFRDHQRKFKEGG